MIDTKALRNKILDLAIQGKLTEQLPEDGTAEELLQEFIIRKKEIEDSGVLKGKKKKNILPLDDAEFPFEIPSNWSWVRLDSIAEVFGRIGFRGYTKDDIVNQGHGAISLSPSNITKDGEIVYDKCTYISWEKYIESPEIMVYEEDVIIVKTGSSYGKCAVVQSLPEKATINPQLAILKHVLCNRYYLHFVLISSMANKQYQDFVIGAATPTFSQEDLANLLLPLPPLSEQERIVEKIEQVFSVLDTIDALQARYADNRKALKSKLIDAAIQGKLTDQLPEDGTAEELFQQIQAKKQKLINAGKIKKEKQLPEITSAEIPFEIPANWKWVRVNDIGSWSAGATPLRGNRNYYQNGTIPWIKTGELKDGYINKAEEYITEDALNECSVRLNPVGSVLIAMYGATIGKVGILEIEATTNQACCACIPIYIDNKYLFYFLKSNKKRFLEASHGGAQPNISKEIIIKSAMPLPPLAEQKRIVDRLGKLLAVCSESK